jgi:hypothetical protein
MRIGLNDFSFGAITDEELEKEKGGSSLRYSFDIRSGKVTYEVGAYVSANSQKRTFDCKPAI